ncbi:MAG TPA: SpoIIE family protein phosphatase [Thermoanaerobaculia bacterium]|nr:SpoIIE family protein phosphatase [Thermoanaerobaculia bacterium]
MARFHDWVELTGTTVRSVGSRGVADLYEREWPAVRQKLLEDHLDAIQREPKRWKRWLRTISALMFGLTARLAPARRLLFLIAIAVGILSFVYLVSLGAAENATVRTLASLFVAFALLVFLLSLELIDKIHLRDELELARELQASLIPKVMPSVPGIEISAFNRIANTVGGDIYDFAPLPDGRLALLFGDASGHGMSAGLVMAVAQAAFRTQLEISADADAMIPALNRLLSRTGGPRSFFTACYVLLAPGGEYTAVVAGHPPVLHFDPSGALVRRLGRGSYPLGIKTAVRWEQEWGVLAPGDSLVFCSDGIPESCGPSETMFGYDRLEEMCARHAGAPDTAQRIIAEWESFTAGRPIEDDVSVAVVRRA